MHIHCVRCKYQLLIGNPHQTSTRSKINDLFITEIWYRKWKIYSLTDIPLERPPVIQYDKSAVIFRNHDKKLNIICHIFTEVLQ